MKLRIRFVLFFLFICPFLSISAPAEIRILATEGKGALIEQNGSQVLLLKGTPFEMGYQHGKLLKEQVNMLVETVLVASNARKPGGLEEAWERTRPFIPERHKEEMKGLAAGSGIPLEKIQLAQSFPELFHCSAILFKGQATADNRMYHIRILDYMTEAGLQNHSYTMVFEPDGYNSFITAGFAGLLGSVTGMNEKQIAIGEIGGAGYGDWDGIPMVFLIRKALEESGSLAEALHIFQTGPRTCEYYYLISDGKTSEGKGIYATPEKFQLIGFGQAHEDLPAPFPEDTILMTAPRRYPVLLERVQENYGEIDLEAIKEIIKLPVSMNSNLHNAIFIPSDLTMHLAVAADPWKEDFQACFQEYRKYNLPALRKHFPETKETGKVQKTVPLLQLPAEAEKVTAGILPAEAIKDFSDLHRERFQHYLQNYSTEKKDIPYTLTHRQRTPDFDMFILEFPSPVKSPHAQNNRVYGEYYISFRDSGQPAVILLDIMEGSELIPRLIAYELALRGINSFMLKLPYYGERRPEGISPSPEVFLMALKQGINDISVAASWLTSREENSDKVNLCGVSLGGLVGALTAGVDGNFHKVCLVMAGGNLFEIMRRDKNASKFIEQFPKEMLEAFLAPMDPITYATRMDNTEVLMINAKDDDIIPASCGEAYYKKLKNATIHWYPGGHYELAQYVPEILSKISTFFREDFQKTD